MGALSAPGFMRPMGKMIFGYLMSSVIPVLMERFFKFQRCRLVAILSSKIPPNSGKKDPAEADSTREKGLLLVCTVYPEGSDNFARFIEFPVDLTK